MTNELELVHQRLERLRLERGARLDRIREDLRRAGAPADPDWPDRAIQRENDETLEELGRVTELQLHDVQHALERLEAGEHGKCETCGSAISAARLLAQPDATACTACAAAASR